MEIQHSHFRGYVNSIGQTSSFSAYEECVSKKKNVYVENNILSMKRGLINRQQITVI